MPEEQLLTSVSPYNKWVVFKSETADGLASILNTIITPHKVHYIIAERGRFYAYCTGDIRIKEMRKKKVTKKKARRT